MDPKDLMAFRAGVSAKQVESTAANAAIAAVAQAASKSGFRTSEFWVTVGGGIASAVVGLVIANPLGLILSGAIAAGVATYNFSRGNVKAALGTAAINAMSATAANVPGSVGDAAKIGVAVVTAAQGSV